MKWLGLYLYLAVAIQAQPLPRLDFNQAPQLQLSLATLDAAVGDLNNDGHPDIVVAGFANDALVFLNQGDGTFDAPLRYPTGDPTDRVILSDVNADGHLDIIALSGDRSTEVVVLLGSGDGTFGPASAYPCDINSRLLAVGDINGDRAPDLLVGAFSESHAVVLFNDGNGRLKQGANVETGLPISSITLADVNADGKLDLVIAHYDFGTVDILRGAGDGTFGDRIGLNVGPLPSLVAVGDYNEDGRADLAVFQSQSVSVWLGSNNGGFTRGGDVSMPYGGGHSKVETCDLNADGHLDLVWVDGFSGTVNILLGNGKGGFTASYYTVGSSIFGVAVGDLNGDGALDIAAPSDWTLNLLFNKKDGTFSAPRYFESLGKLVDLNGDGQLDAIAVSYTNKIFVRIGKGDGTFGDMQTNYTSGRSSAFALGDVNSDGRVDAVVPLDNGRLEVLQGLGDGTFTNAPVRFLSVQPIVSIVALADLDNDGKLDLVLRGAFSNAIVMLGKGDGTFGPELPIADSAELAPLNVADFNNDGNLDIILGLAIFLGHGDGTFSLGNRYDLPGLTDVDVADLNADGNLDLVASSSRGPVHIYVGDGQGGFVALPSFTQFSAVANAAVADFNLDGRLDLSVGLEYDGTVYLGNGDGTFVPGGDFLFGNHRVADVNGDGQPDILSGTVLLNQTFTRLDIARGVGGLRLSWPSYTAGFVLESTENLLAPDWQRVPGTPSVDADRYVHVLTNALSGTSRFWRLRRM